MVVLRMRREERAAQGHRHHYLCEAGMLSCKCYIANCVVMWRLMNERLNVLIVIVSGEGVEIV
jgi:hypothetical protein